MHFSAGTCGPGAAAYLDITRSTLLYRMQKYGLERENVPADAEPKPGGTEQ